MALDYLAAVAARQGWASRVFDADIYGRSALRTLLERDRFDLIALTCMSLQVDEANAIAAMSRTIAPDTPIVRGGPHDTFAFREALRAHGHLYDALVVGEGEEPFALLLDAVVKRRLPEERHRIPGVAFWDGEVRFSPARGATDVNEALPLRLDHDPSYDFDVFGRARTAQVLGTRGCEYSCFYCSESVAPRAGQRRERRRSVESLVREFHQLVKDGYRAVYFDDPSFTYEREWVLGVSDALASVGLKWGCNTRVDLVDETLIARMRGSGCDYLFTGFESAVPEVLLAMNKTSEPHAYIESAMRSYAAMRRNGLPCSAFLIFGGCRRERVDGRFVYSPETDADVRASLDFVTRELDPDYLSMNILRFLPGVPFSFAPQFACIRPTGDKPVHGGHYDAEWLAQNRQPDLRTRHPIYRAFEGCGSVSPITVPPERAYAILALAVELVNEKNSRRGARQTRIVVSPRFREYMTQERSAVGEIRHSLAPLGLIERTLVE